LRSRRVHWFGLEMNKDPTFHLQRGGYHLQCIKDDIFAACASSQ